MGFSEIFLLGCDCDYGTSKKNHIVDYNMGAKLDDLRMKATVDNLILAYKAAKRYADAHGVRIYNATRGGKLEVFERVDLDETLNKK